MGGTSGFDFEGELPAERRRWLLDAANTAPIDRGRARKAVEDLYVSWAHPGRRGPESVFFLDSPQQCAIAVNLLNYGLRVQPRSPMDRSRLEHLRPLTDYKIEQPTRLTLAMASRLFDPDEWQVLQRELRDYLSARLQPMGNLIAANIMALHGRPIGTPVVGGNLEVAKEKLLDQLTRSGWTEAKESIETRTSRPEDAHIEFFSVGGQMRGGFDAYEIALAGFCHANGWDAQSQRLRDIVDARMSCGRQCGWVIPFETVALVSDRPEVIEFDGHADGVVREVRYRDGFRVRLPDDC